MNGQGTPTGQRSDRSQRSQRPPRAVPRTSARGERSAGVLRVSDAPEPPVPSDRRGRSTATRVFLVVSDALYRGGLRALLEGQPDLDVVGEASDCVEAAARLPHLEGGAVLLDTRGLGKSPLAAIRALSGRALLVLTTPCGEPVDEAAVLQAGASGLLLNTTTPGELAAALRVVAAGYTLHLPPTTDRTGATEIHEHPPVELPGDFQNLTPREQDVFRLMACGFGNAEIAAMLQLGESTIKSHVQHLLTKLGIPNRVHAVIYAYQHGLATEPRGTLSGGRSSRASAVA